MNAKELKLELSKKGYATPKYDYDFFLFTQLAYAYGKINSELEYDLVFGDIIKLYKDFLKSNSNQDTKGLYECYEHYFMQI